MNIGTVQGGTHAGWRRVRPAHQRWFCGCFVIEPVNHGPRTSGDNVVRKLNPGYRGKCDNCGETRPA
jgi:hypothetical protein